MTELGTCGHCGVDNWKLLYHDDTSVGGGWMYRCGSCKQITVYIDYSDTGFDDFGKANEREY